MLSIYASIFYIRERKLLNLIDASFICGNYEDKLINWLMVNIILGLHTGVAVVHVLLISINSLKQHYQKNM